MTEYSDDNPSQATAFWKKPIVLASAILAVGLGVGGFMTGDGLVPRRKFVGFFVDFWGFVACKFERAPSQGALPHAVVLAKKQNFEI